MSRQRTKRKTPPIVTKDNYTKEEWEQEGLRLFGENREHWTFVCPRCGNKVSVARARTEFPALKGSDWKPHQECIGRYLPEHKCDWCSYGLFRGPVIVAMPEGDGVAVFRFAQGESR